MLGEKDKNKTADKSENATDKCKDLGERNETQKISKQGQPIQAKQVIPKWRKNMLPASWWRMHENIPTTGCKGSKTILK